MISDTPARRLLAGLVDERDLETEPIAEVRADLAALGLDPARAVALARRLAAGAASPAVVLLDKIAVAEDDDDEIARLEHAEADSLRRRLGEGTAAAAIANAHRAAGGHSNVTGFRRRRPRRLLYGLGGLAVALAASVVFYVGLSPMQYDLRDKTSGLQHFSSTTSETAAAPAPAAPPAEPYRTVADERAKTLPAQSADADAAPPSPSPPAASLTDNLQARMEPAGKGPAEVAQQAAEQVGRQRLQQQLSADAETGARAKSEADEKRTSTIALGQPQSQPADAPSQTPSSATTRAGEEANIGHLQGGMQSNQIAPPFGISHPIVALLIVDPKLVPAGVKQENYPTGDLSARLDEARRLAGDRSIVALVTVRLPDRPTDAVVLAGTAERGLAVRRDLDKTTATSASSAAGGDSGYDIILLDRR